MRVVFITSNFPNPLEPTRGMFNFYAVRALAKTNDVVVISQISWRDEWRLRRRGRTLARTRVVDGIEIHHPRHWYPPGVWRRSYGWFLWQSVRPTVRDVLSRFQPDIVYGYWVHPDGDVALRISAACGAPGVVVTGGSDVLVLGRDQSRRRCLSDVLHRADGVVCVSRHLKKAVEEFGVPAERVHVVRNGVDATRFVPGDREAARRRLGLDPHAPALLFVGRMAPVKGLDVLLDAYAASRPDETGATLFLVGDGPLRQDLADRAARLGVEDRVRFVGNVTHDELATWYQAADLTVLTSCSEGSPNVLLESIACGTPFIASDVGGIPEFADPVLDCLVPAGDAAALAGAIREGTSVRRPAGRARLICNWDDHASEMEAVFEAAKGVRRARLAGGEGRVRVTQPGKS